MLKMRYPENQEAHDILHAELEEQARRLAEKICKRHKANLDIMNSDFLREITEHAERIDALKRVMSVIYRHTYIDFTNTTELTENQKYYHEEVKTKSARRKAATKGE